MWTFFYGLQLYPVDKYIAARERWEMEDVQALEQVLKEIKLLEVENRKFSEDITDYQSHTEQMEQVFDFPTTKLRVVHQKAKKTREDFYAIRHEEANKEFWAYREEMKENFADWEHARANLTMCRKSVGAKKWMKGRSPPFK